MTESAADLQVYREAGRLEVKYCFKDGRIWPLALIGSAWLTIIMVLWTDCGIGESLGVGLGAFLSGLLSPRLAPSSRITLITVDSESVERHNVGASFDPGFGGRQNSFLLRNIEPASLAKRYWSFFGIVQIDFRLAGQDKVTTLSVTGREKGERVYDAIRERLAAVHG